MYHHQLSKLLYLYNYKAQNCYTPKRRLCANTSNLSNCGVHVYIYIWGGGHLPPRRLPYPTLPSPISHHIASIFSLNYFFSQLPFYLSAPSYIYIRQPLTFYHCWKNTIQAKAIDHTCHFVYLSLLTPTSISKGSNNYKMKSWEFRRLNLRDSIGSSRQKLTNRSACHEI